MKRRVLLLIVFVLMEVLFVVAMAAPALAAGNACPFGCPPGASPGSFVRGGTGQLHDPEPHATAQNNRKPDFAGNYR